MNDGEKNDLAYGWDPELAPCAGRGACVIGEIACDNIIYLLESDSGRSADLHQKKEGQAAAFATAPLRHWGTNREKWAHKKGANLVCTHQTQSGHKTSPTLDIAYDFSTN